LKPIWATRQNQLEFMPTKKPPPNEKAENLPAGGCAKTCLLKNIWPKTIILKSAVAEDEYIFLWRGLENRRR
jgi:hypothetical protein